MVVNRKSIDDFSPSPQVTIDLGVKATVPAIGPSALMSDLEKF